ncbi:Spc19-domain-containing protein [Mucidula mucida]|nr:Spc19-domain-containing protein [Mucidula mucida]
MSRLSRANLKARDSVFNSGREVYLDDYKAICPPNLIECVTAMEDCCEEAREAELLLRNGTYDYPRMSKVLRNERVFLIVNDGLVKSYKADLIDEVEPAINDLIERAERGLKQLQRKEAQLQNKAEALKSLPAKPATGTMAQHKLDQRRLHTLTKQRARLQDEYAALEAEVQALETKAIR